MKCQPLTKAFAAVATVMVLGGCSTVCGTRECRLEESVRTMLGSDDPGIKASGAMTLEKLHPEIAENNDEVRRALIPMTIQCTVAEIKEIGGVKMASCVMAPSINR